jgi:hypothetical protein
MYAVINETRRRYTLIITDDNKNGIRIDHTFDFGKIDYVTKGRRNCRVTVHVTLNKGAFSASGCIWNHLDSACYSGGQNLDEIRKYITDPRFETIYEIWKRYHLNNLRPGTPAQLACLADARESFTGQVYNNEYYDWQIATLVEAGLYEDPNHDNYRYGSGWLKEEIPTDVIKTLWEVCGNDGN